MTLMIPLGPVTFSPTGVAVLLLAIAVLATAAALARPSRGLGWSEVRRPVGER